MSSQRFIGGIMLIAGTTIGAAVLALPIKTHHLGLPMALSTFTVAWVFMTLSALAILETNLRTGRNHNLIGMAESTLGKFGKQLTWGVYLTLLYTLMAGYLSGAAQWVITITPADWLTYLGESDTYALTVAAFLVAMTIWAGTQFVDRLNRLILVALIIAFIVLMSGAAPTFSLTKWQRIEGSVDWRALPLLITAFGYAIIIPSLTQYVEGNAFTLRKMVLWGSIIPLALYAIWEGLVLGVVDQTTLNGLSSHPLPVVGLTEALSVGNHSTWLEIASQWFSVTALSSSLIGVSLCLFDFLADGLKLEKKGRHRIVLLGMTVLPPLALMALFPYRFLDILQFAGIIISVLLGILPILMCWQARAQHPNEAPQLLPGGSLLMALTALFFFMIIGIEWLQVFG